MSILDDIVLSIVCSIVAYSHSQLKTFDECQLRFRYKYIDKIPEPATTPSPALKFGTILHDVLEQLYKQIQNSGQPLAKEILTDRFRSQMSQFRDEYDAVSDVSFSSQDFDDRIALGIEMIDRYYETYAPFDQMKVNGLEQHVNFSLSNGSKFRGVIDRLDIKDGQAVIVDYKTDKSIAPYGAFADTYQQQINTYAHRVMQHYPHAVSAVSGKLIYLRLQEEITWTITTEMLEQAITTIESKIAVIEDTLFRYNMGEKDAFWPTEWYQCRRCAYQAMCPLRKHKFQEDEVIVTEIGETTIKKLVDKIYHLTNQKKEIEDNLKGIKEFLEQYVQSHRDEDRRKLYGEEWQVEIRYNNDYNALDDKKDDLKQRLIDHDMMDCISLTIKTSPLTKALKSDPNLMSQLANMIHQQEQISIWRAKEKKG